MTGRKYARKERKDCKGPVHEGSIYFPRHQGEKRWVDVLRQSLAFHRSHNNPEQQTLRLYQWKIIKAEMETEERGCMCMWAGLWNILIITETKKTGCSSFWRGFCSKAFLQRWMSWIQLETMSCICDKICFTLSSSLIRTQCCSHGKAISHKMPALLWCREVKFHKH